MQMAESVIMDVVLACYACFGSKDQLQCLCSSVAIMGIYSEDNLHLNHTF